MKIDELYSFKVDLVECKSIKLGNPIMLLHPSDYEKHTNQDKTKLSEWADKNRGAISYRLWNGIKNYCAYYEGAYDYYEDIPANELNKIRNIGHKSIVEFINIRGY